jgi:hypothetical protein
MRRVGSEDDLCACRPDEGDVLREVAGIPRVVFLRSELSRVDKDSRDNDIGMLPGEANEAEMSFVQSPHRGDDRDAPPLCPQIICGTLHIRDAVDNSRH